MKKLLFTLCLTIGFISSSFANSAYYVDDTKVEVLLESSEQINPFENGSDMANLMSVQAADPNVWVACIIDFFLGGLAIHRVYLGGTWVLILGYFFTFGGIFGIIPLGDLIAMIINSDDISKYVGSNAFIMW
ncbi:TM2 domain-containing protein [Ekhidna sp.]|uniref:TM2 domain-containing protein n=1 Tax=Ekhidna sp. TaxID=2608089 RepID=UPI0032981418